MKASEKIAKIRHESGLDHRKFATLLNGHFGAGSPKINAVLLKRFEEGEYIGHERSDLIESYLKTYHNFQLDSDVIPRRSTLIHLIKYFWLEILLLLVAASYIVVSVIFSFQNLAEIILGVTTIIGLIALRDILKKRS